MVNIERKEYCAFHFHNTTDGECANCGLAICNLDQHYDVQANRLCQICFNLTRAQKIARYMQFGLWGIIIGLVVMLYLLLRNSGQTFYAFLPVLLLLVVPYALRPILMKLYFRDLQPIESVLPILRYFEGSGNIDHYKLFMKFLGKLSEEELKDIQKPLYDYLIPALAFNYSKLPEDWEDALTKNLQISKERFVDLLTEDYRQVLIQTSVHNAQTNMSLFIFYLSEIASDMNLIKEYITEMTSPEVMKLNKEEVNIIYKSLLEDLYLYEDRFFNFCDELGLEKQKDLLVQLIERFDPPPVPKNQLEAVMTIEQLREKRKKEAEQDTEQAIAAIVDVAKEQIEADQDTEIDQ